MSFSKLIKAQDPTLKSESDRAKQSQNLLESMNPFNTSKPNLPRYGSGARSLIRIGGKPIAVAQSFRWQISYNATPIHTLDSLFPWDIDIGQVRINGRLEQIIDPTDSAEANGLFHTMQSVLHQPLVEMQVLDALGTSIFFCRGMFIELNGSLQQGQLGIQSVTFIGVAYQNNVFQEFQPYTGVAGAADKLTSTVKNFTSKISGGFL